MDALHTLMPWRMRANRAIWGPAENQTAIAEVSLGLYLTWFLNSPKLQVTKDGIESVVTDGFFASLIEWDHEEIQDYVLFWKETDEPVADRTRAILSRIHNYGSFFSPDMEYKQSGDEAESTYSTGILSSYTPPVFGEHSRGWSSYDGGPETEEQTPAFGSFPELDTAIGIFPELHTTLPWDSFLPQRWEGFATLSEPDWWAEWAAGNKLWPDSLFRMDSHDYEFEGDATNWSGSIYSDVSLSKDQFSYRFKRTSYADETENEELPYDVIHKHYDYTITISRSGWDGYTPPSP